MRLRRYYSALHLATAFSLLCVMAMAGCSQAAPEAGRGPLMVAGFQNDTGNEAYRFWDPWMSDMLIRNLWQEGSPVVWSLARTLRVRSAAGDSGRAAVLDACRQAGAGVVVFGRVSQEADGLLVAAELVSATGGESLGILEERVATAMEIPAAVDWLRDGVWRALGIAGPEAPLPVSALTTTNLDAYGEFIAGEVLFYQQRYLAAQEKFRLAGNEDPEFALAHYRKATARLQYLVGNDDQARAFITMAWAKREHASERDRLAIVALRALIFGEYDKARATYGDLRSRYPGDREQAYYHGLAHTQGGDLKDARSALSTAVAIDPRFIPGLTALANVVFVAGELERAGALVAQGLEVNPVDPGLLDVGVQVELFRGRLDAADALIQLGMDTRSSTGLKLAAGNLLLLRGDTEAAMEQFMLMRSPFSVATVELYDGRINAGLARLFDSSQLQIAAGNFNTAVVALWIASLIMGENGNPDLAFEQLTKAINLTPDFPDTMAALGVLAARNGNAKRASQVLAGFREWGKEVKESRWRRQALFLEGEVAVAQGDHERSLELLSEARDLAGVRLLGGGLISDRPLMTEALARAQLAAGHLDAAEELYREIAGMEGERLYWPWIWLGAHVNLAELAVRDGRQDEAIRWAEVVRQYWGGAAGEQQPLVDEALARLDRIVPGS